MDTISEVNRNHLQKRFFLLLGAIYDKIKGTDS